MHGRLCAAAAIIATLAVGAGAQNRPPEAVELVTMDFRALRADHGPLEDLRAADLTLKVDGRPREIRSLRFVRAVPDRRAALSSAAPSAPLPPPFGTNDDSGAGRAIVLIVENESLRPGTDRQALGAAARFVRTLFARDRVALLTMPRGGVLVDFTTDHDTVASTLGSISGQAGSGAAAGSDAALRTRMTLTALTDLLEGLAASEGPKTVILVSSGVLRPTRDAPMVAPPGPGEIRPAHYDDLGIAADKARAQFYVVRPEDLIVDSAVSAIVDPTASRFRSSDEEVAGLESVAGVTNGTLFRLPRGDDSAFALIDRETAGHYLLAFQPEPAERNGSSHRIELRSTREDATLRVRRHLFIPRTDERPKSAMTPQAMLRDGRPHRDLPIRTLAFAAEGAGGSKLKIVSLVEPVDPGTRLAAALFALIDRRDRLVAQWTADAQALAATPVMSAGLAAPGDYRLRTAALDSAGRRGTAEYDLSARLTSAGRLALSAMALGVSRGGGFAPRLLFAADPTAMGYLEIYGRPGAGALTVALEIAAAPHAPAIVRVPGSVTARGEDAHVAVGIVPIAALAPGDYVVRAIVSLEGRPIGRVEQTLRKATAPPPERAARSR